MYDINVEVTLYRLLQMEIQYYKYILHGAWRLHKVQSKSVKFESWREKKSWDSV